MDRAQGSLWWGPREPIYQGSGDPSPAWRLGEIIPGYFSPTFGIFSFVGDTRVASVSFNNLSKVCKLLIDLGVLKLDS